MRRDFPSVKHFLKNVFPISNTVDNLTLIKILSSSYINNTLLLKYLSLESQEFTEVVRYYTLFLYIYKDKNFLRSRKNLKVPNSKVFIFTGDVYFFHGMKEKHQQRTITCKR